jgi:glycosyltransferase involved in cell wall biosynthesis
MRLLFLSSFYPPFERGGFEQIAHEVTVALQQRQHTVHVLTSQYGMGAGTPPDTAPAAEVTRTLYLQADVNYYSISDFFLKRRKREQHNAQQLRLTIERVQPDLIVVWNMWDLTRNLPYWAEQLRPRQVAYYLSSTWPADIELHREYWQLPAKRITSEWLKRPLRALALAQLKREGYPPRLRFEHVACVSRFVQKSVVDSGQALPASTRIIHNGIHPEPFIQQARTSSLSRRPLRLLYFGGLLTIKGVHTAIEALGELKQRSLVDQVELTLLGDGHPDYVAHLHELAADLEVAERVRFADRVARSEVPDCLGQYDVFLFTSIGPEALARTVMEAMAAKLLVIGAETGGQVEMFESDRNALTFKAGDAIGLANQIERALCCPEWVEQIAQAGQQSILERFTLDKMVDNFENWILAAHENSAR